jgi:MFS family permease
MAGQNKKSSGNQEKWLNRNIFGMGLASLFSDWNHEMASAVLPLFLSSVLHAPAFALGAIEGVADGISTIFEVWSGWYSDRIGKRKGLAAIGYFITAFSKASFALATNWWQVLVGRTAGWIGWSVRSPVRDALLVESTRPETIGRAFAFHRTMDTLGAIAGPLTATLLLAHVPIRTIFLISLVPGLCAFLSILLLVREKPKQPDTRNTLQSMKDLSSGFKRFLIPVTIFGISNFAPTFLILRAETLLSPGHSVPTAGILAVGLYTFSNVVYALVAYPIGVLADRYSKRFILTMGYILFALVCFGFIIVDGHLCLLVLLFALNGMYTAIIESSQPALASTLIADDQHGAGYGIMSAVDGLGDFLSSITIGLLWTFLSPAIGFLFGGVLALLAAIILFSIHLPGQHK